MPSMTGDIELMPVADVLAWIGNRKLTVTFAVRRGAVETRFTIREGRCWQATSSDPREFLGQHLINFGYLTEDQLQRAFDTQKETHVPLGRVLVMVDAVSREQLQRVLLFKTRESLLEAFCSSEGSFRVATEVDGDRELDVDRGIDLQEVHSEGLARQTMWTEIRRIFPSDATRCDVLVADRPVDSVFDQRLLAMMRTGQSVGEAALELRAMDFQTYARLYDLYNKKAIRPRLETHAVPASALPRATGPTAPVLMPPRERTPASQQAAATTKVGPATAKTMSASMAMTRTVVQTLSPTTAAHIDLDVDLSLPDDDIDVSIDISEHVVEEAKAALPPLTSDLPAATAGPAGYVGAGMYMMVKPAAGSDPPGVVRPPEATDPAAALRFALAGRNWSEALLLAQRILEVDPIQTEAIAAFRVAEAQLRKMERESSTEIDFNRVPQLIQARDQLATAHLSSKERYVLSRIDGKRSLNQIAAVSPIQRTELLRIVNAFVTHGILQL